jgi:hypothetical protein
MLARWKGEKAPLPLQIMASVNLLSQPKKTTSVIPKKHPEKRERDIVPLASPPTMLPLQSQI